MSATPAGLDAATEDFARDRVADSASAGLLRIVLILIGSKVALTSFLTGTRLMSALGVRETILVTVAGGIVLALVSVPSAIAGAMSRLSTYMLIKAAFGDTGGKLVNGLVSLTVLGWFGVIASMFGQTIAQLSAAYELHVGVDTALVLGCALVVVTAVYGFRALDLLSRLTTPLKVVLLGWMVWTVIDRYGVDAIAQQKGTGTFDAVTGISIVVGTVITGALVQPDICRFARTPLIAGTASFLTFAIGTPIILLLAGLPGLVTGEFDLVTIMLTLGLGVPALLILLASAWTMNTFNLYASSLLFATIFTGTPRWRLTIAAGVIGTALGLFGISDRLVPYMLLLSVCIPPIAGVYLTNFYYGRLRNDPSATAANAAWRPKAFIACILAVAVAALCDHFNIRLTTIPPVDSLLISIAAYVGLRWLDRPSYAVGALD